MTRVQEKRDQEEEGDCAGHLHSLFNKALQMNLKSTLKRKVKMANSECCVSLTTAAWVNLMSPGVIYNVI